MRIAATLGVNIRQVGRWRRGQRLKAITADRAAVRLGLHPCLLWPEWFEEIA